MMIVGGLCLFVALVSLLAGRALWQEGIELRERVDKSNAPTGRGQYLTERERREIMDDAVDAEGDAKVRFLGGGVATAFGVTLLGVGLKRRKSP